MNREISFFQNNKQENSKSPLAERMRPDKIDNVIGQNEVLAENSLLKNMIKYDDYQSFILWGPPGCGKTTIARIIEKETKNNFVSFSAVLTGIKDVKEVMKYSEQIFKEKQKKTIVFIDEIHRFNKSQQDAFLHYVENGSIILIGATTENPSFEIISALLSRTHVFILNKLGKKDIRAILKESINKIYEDKKYDERVLDYIYFQSGGDARKSLNYLEIILKNLFNDDLDVKNAQKILKNKSFFYDKDGEEHYNIISALHKSIRGSDPQAGLYWLARMLEAGEDPMYITRRLVRLATEDVGLADPNALQQAIAAKQAVHFLGMPEAETVLTQLVVYLATAPKSNSTETAYLKAKKDALKTNHYAVPMHIRNAPTDLMKEEGYGEGYKYSHDYENNYAYQKYFPKQMPEKIYYEPSKFGFEKDIKKRIDWWKKLSSKKSKLKSDKK